MKSATEFWQDISIDAFDKLYEDNLDNYQIEDMDECYDKEILKKLGLKEI